MDLEYVLMSGMTILPGLFFWPKMSLAICSLLCFHSFLKKKQKAKKHIDNTIAVVGSDRCIVFPVSSFANQYKLIPQHRNSGTLHI